MAKKKETATKAKETKAKAAPKKRAAKPAPKGRAKAAQTEPLRISRDILAMLTAVLAAALIALSIRTFGFSFAIVRSDAMAQTLLPGDIVLLSRAAEPETGNIVLAGALNGSAFRRVAGEPGDTVRAKDGKVMRNGLELYEPYATGEMNWEIPQTVLQDGVYLLLPDNRAYESALVESGGVAGVVRAVIWPLSRAGFF